MVLTLVDGVYQEAALRGSNSLQDGEAGRIISRLFPTFALTAGQVLNPQE